MCRSLVFFVWAFALTCNVPASAQDTIPLDAVYMIEAKFGDRIRSGTGFMVEDYSEHQLKGIITALHLVIGHNANGISADLKTLEEDNVEFPSLELVAVDIGRDLAFLTSEKVNAADVPCVNVVDEFDWGRSTNSNYRIIGHPNSSEGVQVTTLVTGQTPIRKLSELIDFNNGKELATRESPDIDVDMVNIHGFLSPGHSGAPIINQEHSVIAVGNGGLVREGGAGYGWAIPIADAQWTLLSNASKSQKSKLDRLKQMKLPVLYESSPTPETIYTLYGDGKSPILTLKFHPQKVMSEYKKFIAELLDDLKKNEGKFNIQDGANFVADQQFYLPVGTEVELLVEEADDPEEEIPNNPLGGLGGLLANRQLSEFLENQYSKVRVIGPKNSRHIGKEYYVPAGAIRQKVLPNK